MSLTSVGDYLARRYPPGEYTHAMGDDTNPLGCLAWHSPCLYAVAWREALRSFAADLDEMAGLARPGTEVRGALGQVAVLAREKAEAAP